MLNKKTYWIFRVASKPEVGGGHMMRCISLALSLSSHVDVHFVLDKGGEFWFSRLKYIKFTAEIIQNNDVSILSLKDNCHCLGVLVDSYDITQDDLLIWKEHFGILAVIDDFGDASEFVDYVISPGIGGLKKKNTNQVFMYGSDYALLSPEYSKLIQQKECSSVNTVLISFGYYDSNNCTEMVLKVLNRIMFNGTVQVAIGSNAPHLSSIKEKLSNYGFKIDLYEDVNGLYELNLNADLVIGAGGVSLLERMALGKPSVTFVVVDNQKQQVNWAGSIGATISLSLNNNLLEDDIINAINSLLFNKAKRDDMSKIAREAVDGKGALRVSEILMSGRTFKENLNV